MPSRQQLTKKRSGGGLLLLRRKTPLTRRSVAYFRSGAHKPGPVPDTCYVFLDYSLSNQGIAPFDIRSVHIRAWRSELPQLAPKMPQFIDTKELEHGQQVIDSSSSELLNMHFAQGESCGRTFSWIFPKQKPAFHIFQVDVEASNGNDIKHISTQTWSQDVCTSAFRRSNASDNKPDSNN